METAVTQRLFTAKSLGYAVLYGAFATSTEI